MDRFALFVDAGYLLAAGGKLCCNTLGRTDLVCAYELITGALQDFSAKHSAQALLRTYWYDGAKNAIPTADHLRIAGLPNVKLRLGRLSGGQQKGVDSLIVRDLMVLARERAMVTAHLLTGDEDLREGVVAAQDMGVRVVVLGVRSTGRNQAPSLILEADEHLILEREFLAPFFTHIKPFAQLPEATTLTRSQPALSSEPAALQLATPEPPVRPTMTGEASAELAVTDEQKVARVGEDFGAAWASSALPEEFRALVAGAPVIPRELDVQLLVAAEKAVGSLRGQDKLRKAVRKAFWEYIRLATATILGSAGEAALAPSGNTSTSAEITPDPN